MFSGLHAFPLTPLNEQGIDAAAFARLVARLAVAKVDAIGALGSTGSYAYLTRAERARVARLAVEHAAGVPVMVGIGALRTLDVLHLASDAQEAGASAVLLAPVSYQRLRDEEVFGLYEAVTRTLSIPLCVYDNPGTTHFEFGDELLGRIAHLPHVGSIKVAGVSTDPAIAKERVERLRAVIPGHVAIGVSNDAFGAAGLNAGCKVWYSVLGGLLPELAIAITRAAQAGHPEQAVQLSNQLEPLFSLFREEGGSLRVIAAAAELLGLVQGPCLPLPLVAIEGEPRRALARVLTAMGLDLAPVSRGNVSDPPKQVSEEV